MPPAPCFLKEWKTEMSNPWSDAMVRMQLAPGMGSQLSVAGFNLSADADNCVTVPRDVSKLLEPHGLKPYVEPEPKKK